MVEEYDSIVQNSVWDVVPRPENKLVVSSRWLYKGIDYDETFAPVTRYSSIKSMLALLAQMGWKIHEMDVKTTFVNGNIEEEVYIEQLEGFETFDRELHVCQLKRALYGLKQAPRAWYTRIDSYFTGLGFTKSEVDVNLHHIIVKGKPLIIILYVDDLILTGNDQLIMSCKENLAREFKMKDMGLIHYFLGMEVWKKDGEVFVSQGKYANETEGVNLQSFTDADWVGSPSVRKSTSGGIFNLGSAAVSWYSKKQRSVALNSTEAEYMATIQAAREAIWMWKILAGLFDQRMDPTVIYCDNQSCIKFSENLVFHDRSNHINI
eukprot:PITA_27977